MCIRDSVHVLLRAVAGHHAGHTAVIDRIQHVRISRMARAERAVHHAVHGPAEDVGIVRARPVQRRIARILRLLPRFARDFPTVEQDALRRGIREDLPQGGLDRLLARRRIFAERGRQAHDVRLRFAGERTVVGFIFFMHRRPAVFRGLQQQRFRFHLSVRHHFKISSTGQWSLPVTSLKMRLSSTRSLSSSVTRK